MIINKLDGFLTDKERELAKKTVSELVSLQASLSSDTPHEEIIKKIISCSGSFEAIVNMALAQYITSSSDKEKFFQDAQEVIDAIEKQDFLDYIKNENSFIDTVKPKIDPFTAAYPKLNMIVPVKKERIKHSFKDCTSYIFSFINYQRKAIYFHCQSDEEKETATKRLQEMAEAKAVTFGYKRPSHDGGTIQPVADISPLIARLPTGFGINAVNELLRAGAAKAEQLPARKRQTNHKQEYSVFKTNNTLNYTVSFKKSYVSIELTELSKFIGNNTAATKLFIMALIKANKQIFHDGAITGQNYITFSLQELVDNGSYSSLNSARAGFKDGMDRLTSLKLKGESLLRYKKNGINELVSSSALEVLFTGAYIENSQCYIFFNERLNWKFMITQYTIIPTYVFSLASNAFNLTVYIFSLARQNTDKIKGKGYFDIGLRSIHTALTLPNDIDIKKPQQYIKEPIEQAITAIEDEHKQVFNNRELLLELHYQEGANITEYLNNGFLRVYLSGEFANKFLDIAKKKEKLEAHRKEKIEKIKIEAAAKKAANEQQEKTENGQEKT